MDYFLNALKQGLKLLYTFDKNTYQIIFLSLVVSLSAVLAATICALPVAGWVSIWQSRFKKIMIMISNGFMATPSVFLGLVLYVLLSKKGLLGFLGLLYTPYALSLGQFLLALPIITSLTIAALQQTDKRLLLHAMSLGATRFQTIFLLMRENRLRIFSAISTGLARAFTEVGCAMIVGGSIEGKTQVITTAMATETIKGEIELAMALGIVSILLAFILLVILKRVIYLD